jgi:cytoskeletal protein CcmA (bactofilin family)
VSKAGALTTVNGGFEVVEASKLTGKVTCSGALQVDTTSVLTGKVTLTNDLEVGTTSKLKGKVTCDDALEVATTSKLSGKVTCEDALQVDTTSAFTGKVTLTNDFQVGTTSLFYGDVTCEADLEVKGDLKVTGTTTTVNTENVLIKDNLMVLNSGHLDDRDSGLLFKRPANDTTAFYFDYSEDCFVMSKTTSAHSVAAVDQGALVKLKCAGIESDAAVSMPGFATVSVDLAGTSGVAVDIPGVAALRGCFEFIIESDTAVHPTGSVYNYKIVKSSAATDSFSSFGVHQEGDDFTQVYIKWDALAAPQIYHMTLGEVGTGNIKYNIKYLRVN